MPDRDLPPEPLSPEPHPPEPLVIDCRTCSQEGTSACDDCVVSFICSRQPDEAVIIDVSEFRALRAMQDEGLLPGLRHQPRTG